jgi:transcriptional regulator with XRE-family HTH domain
MKTIVNFKKVKELREKQGWSQIQLAEMSDISIRTIQRIEKDGKSSIESIKSIASVFEVDFREILIDDSIKIGDSTKKENYTDFLVKVDLGKQIIDLLGNKEVSDFDFEPSIIIKKQLDLIHSFFQDIQDYNDILNNFEVGGYSEVISNFQELINELQKENLWVFAGEIKREYGNFQPPTIFNVIVVRVLPIKSQTIINVDLSELTEV